MDDVEEIRKLKARYFRALDTKDWDLYEAVFAPDVVVDLTRAGGQRVVGRDAFMDYARAMTILQSVHHGHMPEIELTGPDSATGVWAMEDYNIWEDGSQNHGWGHYLETYVKRDGRWQIATMALSYLRIERSFGTPPIIAGADGRAHLKGPRPAG
ncbi:nuclear transport factor 2 family protein [Novosphingobium sp. 9U]|uniref:nuclear transport factor 2 family protein n=1 Tax=Novosphingobium sp. 9U TaxID=2653158 RepID=UPI0012F35A6F|nr:nuclear transport factor 2 family protein [Novosphingobium sp. 9U]VWX46789.1 putative Bile acid 7-alpha dehydratase [Novosphingobium sp. 9U]